MAKKRSIDLDVEGVEEVAPLLRRAAKWYRESADELADDEDDERAGKPWAVIAKVLDAAAEEIDGRLSRLVAREERE